MKFGNLDIELITVYATSNVTVIFKKSKRYLTIFQINFVAFYHNLC